MFRPQDLSLIAADDEPFGDTIRLTGRITRTEFHGSTTRYVIDLAGQTVCMDRPADRPGDGLEIGDELVVGIDPARIRILEQ